MRNPIFKFMQKDYIAQIMRSEEEKTYRNVGNAVLFLVPSPIGNLRDITLRALDVLREVDLIACEDTRHTRKLLSAYGIRTPLMSYERFSEQKKTARIIERLASGRSVALVSDAGTPLISDPGAVLISRARELGVRIEALPGPSAVLAAVSASGFEGPFRFIGFFPRQKSAAVREAMRMKLSADHTVFYESPHRIMDTLRLLAEHLEDHEVFLAREMSKVHEEYLLGTAREVSAELSTRKEIGEVTVMVRGAQQEEPIDEESLRRRALQLMEEGPYSRKDVLRVLVDETGLGRNRIYRLIQNLD